jgi:hypothetical protein
LNTFSGINNNLKTNNKVMKQKTYGKLWSLAMSLMVILLMANCSDDETPTSIPAGNFTTTISAGAGEEIVFTGTATDEIGLTSISLSNSDLLLDKIITIADAPTSFALEYAFTIPAGTADGSYTVAGIVSNTSGSTVEFSVTVTVATVVVDTYDNIWVAGGVLWWEWGTSDGFFYEMIRDTENEGWFEILLPSWGGDGGWDQIKFVAQNAWATDAGGVEWGVADNSATTQEIFKGIGENVDALTLPDLGKNPAYYKVRFNPNTEEYTAEEIIPTEAAPAEMYIVGVGFPDYPLNDWDPAEAIPMSTDHGYGEYQFLADGLVFSDDVALKFIGQNDGWSPIDVGFDDAYLTDADADTDGWQVVGPINWKPTKSGDGTADLKFVNQAGTYTVYFDYFLQRAYIFEEYE